MIKSAYCLPPQNTGRVGGKEEDKSQVYLQYNRNTSMPSYNLQKNMIKSPDVRAIQTVAPYIVLYPLSLIKVELCLLGIMLGLPPRTEGV